MSAADPPPSRRARRRFYALSSAILAAAGIGVAIGPGAPWIVDHLVDGVRVWRLGRIAIDGVSGRWLGDLHAEHISIADDQGDWVEAQDVDLRWRPQRILVGAVHLDEVRAAAIIVHRYPTLTSPRPQRNATFDINIESLSIESFALDEAVVGAQAEFTANLGLSINDETIEALDVSLQRTDSDADHVAILYREGDNYALTVDAVSAPGGILARLLGVADSGVSATGQGEGDARSGRSRFTALVGERTLLSGASEWNAEAWRANAEGRLDILPATAATARRIGANFTVRINTDATRRMEAHAETPFISIDIEGVLNAARGLDGPAQFVATTERLSDIARESPFELGVAQLQGELRLERGVSAIRATLNARSIDALGQHTSLSGPVSASLTQAIFSLDADLRAPADARALFEQARLKTDLSYDRRRRRFSLASAELTGAAIAVDARGWVNRGAGAFAGEWRVRQLQALSPNLRGEAGGRWRSFANETGDSRIWTTSVEGVGVGVGVGGAPATVAQLLGAAPQLDARFVHENGGVTVSHARMNGAQLRAAATGRIVRGQADLALEAAARGPLSLGDAEITGALDMTGRVTGRIGRPTVSARASLASVAVGGVTLENPKLDFVLAPTGASYVGRANIESRALSQSLNAAADVSIANSALALNAIDAQWGGLAAQGAAAFNARGVTATLDINGAIDGLAPGLTGRLAGDLALTPEQLTLDAQIRDARAGELHISAASIRAHGPFDALTAAFDLRGRLRQAPLVFAGTAELDLDGASALNIEGRGTLAGADIFTRAPMQATWRDGTMQASLNVAVGDGIVQANWTERGRAISGAARIDDAPLAPLAAIWGERASGRIDGAINLASASRGLSGDINVSLAGARFAGRQRGALDMRIVGRLDPSRLAATIDASSTEGLLAHFEADAPVVTSASPIRIALAPERRGRARWSVHGPAESLWTAARLPNQSLQGQIDGEGELSFGAGYLSGDGHVEIIDGRFEDKLTGVSLVDLDARAVIDSRGVTLENFTASGPHGGRISATGGSSSQREGRIAVRIDNMRVADRPDARAVASGDLSLAWEGLHSVLSGELNIIEAELDAASSPNAGIPTLDVIEINQSGEEAAVDAPPAEHQNGSTALDVRINAPGRVFTRGRGVDAEWALNLRLQGTARNPRLFGDARAIRGSLALSGQPFEIEDARIFFTGDPLDAQISLTAVRDAAELSARIRLTGTARDPEIAFSSDPPLPEDEILPQILFGRSVEDLSAFEAAQLAASLAALSGRASLDLMDAARAAAGLDRLNVRQDEDGGFLVAGGVYLTRNVYVEVARTGLGQAQSRVEYTIRPRLVLITSFLGNGDQRVSLRWRRESD